MKKISLLILMLTFLLIPTCVNANNVSWEDFINRMEEATGDSNFEENIKASSEYNDFVNRYNTCYGFSVWGDFGFASISPTQADNTKLWFCFYDSVVSTTSGQFYFSGTKTTDSNYLLKTYNSTYVFIYDIENNTLTESTSTNSQNLFYYYLSANNTFSLERFLSETGADYFLDTSLVMAWNMNATVQYLPDASSLYPSYVTKVVDLSTIDDSDYPWEDNGNGGGFGSGDTYFNYDFNEYFQKPWISVDTVNGMVQANPLSQSVNFSVYSQSGDEYFPFDKLKMDLRVYKIVKSSDGSLSSSLHDTYRNYLGEYVDTSSYSSVSVNNNILKYTYDLRTVFDSEFLDLYIGGTSGDSVDYAMQLVLYSFWEDELSSTKFFYFNYSNDLNNIPIPDDYYNNNWNSGGNFNFENMNFDSILNTAKNFLSSIFSVFEIFPDWLIYLLAFGIAVGISLRILGR